MPKIRIKEIDTTGINSLPSTSNVVYIPGAASVAVEPVLFTSPRKFKAALDAEGTKYIPDDSSKLAYHLLTLGLQVLYEGFVLGDGSGLPEDMRDVSYTVEMNARDDELVFTADGVSYAINAARDTAGWVIDSVQSTASITTTSGIPSFTGFNGLVITLDFVTNKAMYTKQYDLSGKPAVNWAKLEDKATYDIRFLTTGAYRCPNEDMIRCAAKRVDAVALLDCAIKETSAANCRSQFDELLSSIINLETGEYINVNEFMESTTPVTVDPLSFAAAFTPYWKGIISGPDGAVTMSEVPASFGYLIAYARSIQNNPVWYAAAGSFRGLIPELVSVGVEYSSADIEVLQARAKDQEVALDDEGDNVGYAINPIAFVRPFGHIVWGNRTARFNKPVEGVGVTKATSFLNCRVLSTEVAKQLYMAARKYTFEQNSTVLWTNFRSEVTPTLDKMESGNGILGYTFSRVATEKKARLKAKVTLIPIEGVEDFDVDIEMTDNIAISE